MRALITGISGQDGSYLSELLVQKGWEVHGLIRREGTLAHQAAQLTCHEGDLADTDCIIDLLQEVEPDVVFNLGGISSVAESWSKPAHTGRVTGLSVAAALEGCWQLQERTGNQVRFIQASSSEIFGSPLSSPQNETTCTAPLNPYGAAKAYAHQLVNVYRTRGLYAASAILYNHESPRRPASFVTRKITRGVALIAAGEEKELHLGNLDSRRDWGWAPDYVRAMFDMSFLDEPQDFVIATGVVHSVREFVEAAFHAVNIDNWEHLVRIDPRFFRPVDTQELRGDPTLAQEVLGWKPTVPFDEIVARMVRHDLNSLGIAGLNSVEGRSS